jgi:hypothetical protein
MQSGFRSVVTMDCFAELAMTAIELRQRFQKRGAVVHFTAVIASSPCDEAIQLALVTQC